MSPIIDNENKKKRANSLDDVIKERLKDEEFKTYFEKEIEINKISSLVYTMRIHSGLSQSELARLADTTQPVVARLESGVDSRIPTLTLLNKLARAMNKKLTLSFE
jgi:DNA-binding XRE family transcriptional regulator